MSNNDRVCAVFNARLWGVDFLVIVMIVETKVSLNNGSGKYQLKLLPLWVIIYKMGFECDKLNNWWYSKNLSFYIFVLYFLL